MKKIIISMCLIVLSSSSLLCFEYVMHRYAGSYASPDTQIKVLSGGDWDNGYFDLNISWTDFYFYGRKVTHLRIMTDGYVLFGFGSVPAGTDVPENASIPLPGAPDGFAAPWWDDWNLTTKGTMWYFSNTVVTAVKWVGVPHNADSSSEYTFQVLLYSSNYSVAPNTIIFAYSQVGSGIGLHDRGKTGTIGIEHSAGCQGEEFSYNTTANISNNYSIAFTPFVPVYGSTNFFNDGLVAHTVFRPSTGTWFMRKRGDTITLSAQWGTKGDVALPGDYDGDGQGDLCVLRPEGYAYTWYCYSPSFFYTWGTLFDIPVPADYNGDGKLDIAVFRPSDGTWYIYYRDTGTSEAIQWGTKGDVPVPSDYDGDGKADCAVYRIGTGTWYVRKSSDPAAFWTKAWGTDGDIPLPWFFASWNYAWIGVYRPSNGMWFVCNLTSGQTWAQQWGAEKDEVVPHDFFASADSASAVFRPDEGTWYIAAPTPHVFHWGTIGDKPRAHRTNFK